MEEHFLAHMMEGKPSFKAEPWYNPYGDCVVYKMANEAAVADRIDELLTIYRSVEDDRAIGFQIKGVLAIIKKFGYSGLRIASKSVDPFIACLRATLAYAGIDKGNINDKINSSLLPENQGQKSDDIPEVLPPSIKPERKRKMSPSGVKEDVFTLDSGEVVLQWPERLSQADFDDFEGWIQLVLRKVKRCITNEAGIGPEESS